MGDYFRVSMDDRDLNYENYFTHGEKPRHAEADYTSDKTEQLTAAKVEQLLRSLPELKLPQPV
ncbi:MAG: UDP-glucose 4-epimerase, partial [Elusimicrobia bacterium]|nr:UDP-glucose 4-epimerase [Elusimicrobiota bacterium]